MKYESGSSEIEALAQRVATARGKLPLQTDPALFDELSEAEITAERELAEWIRAQRRRQRRRAVVAELSAEKRDRRVSLSVRRADDADLRWHRRALAARRRVSNPDARLAQLYRRAEWTSRALIGVVILGMLWSGVNVQHNLVPSGDLRDPLYWLSYGFEAMISIPIIAIMVVATTAARWGREIARGKVVFLEAALLGVTIALNAGPHLVAHAPSRAAEAAVAPVMVGVVIWLHAWVSARYAQLIDSVPIQEEDSPGTRVMPSERGDLAITATDSEFAVRSLGALSSTSPHSHPLTPLDASHAHSNSLPTIHNGHQYSDASEPALRNGHTHTHAPESTGRNGHTYSPESTHNGHGYPHASQPTTSLDYTYPLAPQATTRNGHIHPTAHHNGFGHSIPAQPDAKGHPYPTSAPVAHDGDIPSATRESEGRNGHTHPTDFDLHHPQETPGQPAETAAHDSGWTIAGHPEARNGHTHPTTDATDLDVNHFRAATGQSAETPTRNGGWTITEQPETRNGHAHPTAEPISGNGDGPSAAEGRNGHSHPADSARAGVYDSQAALGRIATYNGHAATDPAEGTHNGHPYTVAGPVVGNGRTTYGDAQLDANHSQETTERAAHNGYAATDPMKIDPHSGHVHGDTVEPTNRDGHIRRVEALDAEDADPTPDTGGAGKVPAPTQIRSSSKRTAGAEHPYTRRPTTPAEPAAKSRTHEAIERATQLSLEDAPVDAPQTRRRYPVSAPAPDLDDAHDEFDPEPSFDETEDFAADIDDVEVWAVAREISERRLSKLPVEQLAEVLTLADESWTPAAIGASIGLPGSRILGILEAARRIRQLTAIPS
ncbi:hypothetical protein [Nocardia pseudobrasiliensis]|uniref:Uncharacterized protein n=1 Tax=Nocardia pseudobrasiliensis TaxID=45979 RepID=A0A370I365_9NOCA|nr:hypothetical protein [Nocardia pseudobrasiliensis]RDI64581.1 hypothetical protein DFR76_108414 [Nocardia pseudobrasiliensis]